LICDPKIKQPLIQVLVLDAGGNPVPGVEVVVEWPNGFDHFFTGLKPELGAGYGDFAMREEVDYTIRLASYPAVTVSGVHVQSCSAEGSPAFPGSWKLTFSQPD
jgi:hypothetical protein